MFKTTDRNMRLCKDILVDAYTYLLMYEILRCKRQFIAVGFHSNQSDLKSTVKVSFASIKTLC